MTWNGTAIDRFLSYTCTLIFVPGPPREEQPMRTEALGVGQLQLPGSLGDSWM